MSDELIAVSAEWAKRAYVDDARYQEMYEASVKDPVKFWGEHGKRVDWIKPYSADAVLTEYWDVGREPNGDQWLVVTSLVDDPKYLQQQYVTSPNFKKEGDGSKWEPTPCSATW